MALSREPQMMRSGQFMRHPQSYKFSIMTAVTVDEYQRPVIIAFVESIRDKTTA